LAHRHFLGYESKRQPLLSRKAFAKRLAASLLAASVLIGVSLLVGMIGYHFLEELAWIDAFANAAMILSGMGPLDAPKARDGKLFAGLYALYSGLAVILAAGILFTPIVHRMLHRFHLEEGKGE
jgi:sterol desaturase/sphingolipid hydroxylase (fatty acid hydroxylase superfamily)